MKLIIYKNDYGDLAMLAPAYKEYMNEQEKNDYSIYVKNKDVPKLPDGSIRPSWIVDKEFLSNVKFLRNSWTLDDSGQLVFRRQKAEELKKNNFRFLRKSLLEKLDVDFMKALESNNLSAVSDIVNKKQILRDITSIDMSQYDTPEKLHNFIPDILKPTV
jgi:hypothetical protein